jgi:fused signal recognition particle receptor
MLDFFRRKKKDLPPDSPEKAQSDVAIDKASADPETAPASSEDSSSMVPEAKSPYTIALEAASTAITPDDDNYDAASEVFIESLIEETFKSETPTVPLDDQGQILPDDKDQTAPLDHEPNLTDSNSDLASSQTPAPEKKLGWFGRLKRKFSSDSVDLEVPEATSETPDDSSRTTATPEAAVTPETAATSETAATLESATLEPEAFESVAAEPPQSTAPAQTEQVVTPPPSLSEVSAVKAPELAEKADIVKPAPISEPLIQAVAESAPPVQEAPLDQAKDQTIDQTIDQTTDQTAALTTDQTTETAPQETEAQEPKLGWFGRLKQKLTSTRDKLAGRLEKVLSAVRAIDDDVLDELEEIMITSDLGIQTTSDILYKIRGQVAKKQLKDTQALKVAIRNRILEMVSIPSPPPKTESPLVIMMVGVNGVGKTTTIAKLTRIYQKEGKKVLLAAGDTFRAAAVEQLTIWAKRLDALIVSQSSGADPSAVVFDALSSAKAKGVDVVIIDTAGRLHTKVNLMDELKKIKRVANKALPGAPHETILVLDANTGQNANNQAKIFNEAIGIDSLIVTKLDGTSKGGVIVSILNEYKIPIKYIGIGETFEDLRPFDPESFVEAIFGSKDVVS